MTTESLLGKGERYRRAYDEHLMGNTTPCSKWVTRLGQTLLLALFIIASITSAGAYPAGAFGWTTLGCGGAYILIKLLGGRVNERKIDLIVSLVVAAILMTCGGLSASGILTELQWSYIVLGVIAATACSAISMMIHARRMRDINSASSV